MRYHFNIIIQGEQIEDKEGEEFASDEAAQCEATAIAAELEREFPHYSALGAIVEVYESGNRKFALPIFRVNRMPEEV